MANGVRLETAYIELAVEADGVTDGIKKSLDNAGTYARDASKKIGKELSAGVSGALKDAGKGAFDGLKKEAEAAGKSMSKQLGDSFDQVGTKVKSATDLVSTMGQKVGTSLQSLQQLGTIGSSAIEALGIQAQGASEKLNNVTGALGKIKTGDYATGLQGISGALREIGQSGAADTIQTIADRTADFQGKAAALKTDIEGTTTHLLTLTNNSGKIAGGLNQIAAAAGPIGATFAALNTLVPNFSTHFNNMLAQIQGKQGFNAKDWVNTLLPGTNFLDSAKNWWDNNTGSHGPPVGKAPTTPSSGFTPNSFLPGGAAGGSSFYNQWYPPSGGAGADGANFYNQMYPRSGAAVTPGSLLGPGKAPESGLQTNTIGASRAISAAFPEIQTIGGVREDALKWHPNGLALDIMIPGQGGLNDPTTPEGLALGNRIWAWMSQHADELGIDMGASLWQQKDHFNHIHLATKGGGNPQGGEQYRFPSFDKGTPGPLTEDMLAQLHKGEVVVPKDEVEAAKNGEPDDALARTAGYFPAAAEGNVGGVAGTSSLAGLFNLGNQAVGGLIDTGASLAQMAIQAGMAAGTFGGSAAAGPAAGAAAGYGIQLAATEGKRLASYGFQMGAIVGDALIEQLFPFGAPRWLGYDYTQFLPELNISEIATTTAEKAMQQGLQAQGAETAPKGLDAAGMASQMPGGPVTASTLPGSQPGSAPVPSFGSKPPAPPPSGPPGTGPGGGGPTPQIAGQAPTAPAAPMGPPVPSTAGPSLPTPIGIPPGANPIQATDLGSLLGVGVYDEGGWLPNNSFALNTSGRPELMIPMKQLEQMNTQPAAAHRGGDVHFHVSGNSPDEIARAIYAKQRLAGLQHTGRPMGL